MLYASACVKAIMLILIEFRPQQMFAFLHRAVGTADVKRQRHAVAATLLGTVAAFANTRTGTDIRASVATARRTLRMLVSV